MLHSLTLHYITLHGKYLAVIGVNRSEGLFHGATLHLHCRDIATLQWIFLYHDDTLILRTKDGGQQM